MNTENSSIVCKINDYFKMPISYIKDKHELKKNISTDLELINTVDGSSNPIYSFCLNTDNDVSKKLSEQMINYYTSDVNFLKDNQKLIKDYVKLETKYTIFTPNYKNIVEIWNELKIESGFREKYYFIDWEVIEFLNKSEIFLQFMSLYNLFSPIFSLMVPIIILIIPFFILKMKGIPLDVSEYITVLKTVAQTNAVGKLFTVNFSEINAQERIYILVSAAFYLFSIYQNIMVCVRFNNNMKTIHNHFKNINLYLENTIHSMENYLHFSKDLTTHEEFNNNLIKKINTLKNLNIKLKSISEYSLYNIGKFKEIGRVLKYFYELHSENEYEEAIMYSLGFNGYIDCIEGLQINIVERKMNFATFITNTKKGIIRNSYYACLKDSNPVKNTIKEARRCKEILDVISDNKKDRHFCAFDELYSGTNPEEAENSATAFMLYLQKYKNVSTLLTTHFVKVCKKLDKIKGIENCKMVTQKTNNKLIYTYKLESGISEVKGGINVLTDMNYPKEIIINSILASNN